MFAGATRLSFLSFSSLCLCVRAAALNGRGRRLIFFVPPKFLRLTLKQRTDARVRRGDAPFFLSFSSLCLCVRAAALNGRERRLIFFVPPKFLRLTLKQRTGARVRGGAPPFFSVLQQLRLVWEGGRPYFGRADAFFPVLQQFVFVCEGGSP